MSDLVTFFLPKDWLLFRQFQSRGLFGGEDIPEMKSVSRSMQLAESQLEEGCNWCKKESMLKTVKPMTISRLVLQAKTCVFFLKHFSRIKI